VKGFFWFQIIFRIYEFLSLTEDDLSKAIRIHEMEKFIDQSFSKLISRLFSQNATSSVAPNFKKSVRL